jgi:hemolysin III
VYKGERFNSISHLVGAVLALVGLVVLVVLAALHGGAVRIVSAAVYGASLLILYTSSTLYHSFKGAAKRVFRRLDHVAIYLLIAGTYTPFTLVVLKGRIGWWLFGSVWALAVVGMLQELRPTRHRWLSVVIYVAMGWIGMLAFKPLAGALGTAGLVWLLVGGLCYTGGVAFYALDRRIPAFHGIWHLFVLAGSLAHFLVIFQQYA